jgi:TRAP-type C4-dicarboxylate transport system permease small subunit
MDVLPILFLCSSIAATFVLTHEAMTSRSPSGHRNLGILIVAALCATLSLTIILGMLYTSDNLPWSLPSSSLGQLMSGVVMIGAFAGTAFVLFIILDTFTRRFSQQKQLHG